MSEPQAATQAPPPEAPGIGELFELSLAAVVNPGSVFARLQPRPAPSPARSAAVALAWGGLFFFLNLVRIAIAKPGMLNAYPAWQLEAVAAAGFGAWLALYLLGSCVLYGIGRALGSEGDFDRALVLAAIALVAAPVQSLCGWVPVLWFLPTALAAWIAASGLHFLFKADAWTARGLCALLAGGALGLQYAASLAADKYAVAAVMTSSQAGPTPTELADIQQQLKQIQAVAESVPATSAPAASSLDLLRGPGGEEPQKRPLTEAEIRRNVDDMAAKGEAMNKSVVQMLDSMAPLLNNPALTKNMTPQMKADFAEMNKLMAEMKTGLQTNTPQPPAERQKQMERVQNLMMRMLSAGMTMPAPAPAPASKEKKK